MRVLTVTNMYPSPGREGWGAFVHSQVESLRAAGIETDVLVIDGYRSRLDYLRAIGRLRRALRATRYDLVHAHYGLSGLVARCQRRVPVVVSFCGDDLHGHAGPEGRPRPSSLPLAWLQRLSSLAIDAAIVKSESMRRLLPRREAAVIPNGVDLATFKPDDRSACRGALGLDPDTVYVLFPYAPERVRKNYDAVAAAVAELDRRRRPGDPPIAILTVQGQPQERLPAYMNAADVFVLASFWEGSPNALKEALACNMRIVATDVGDVRERLAGVAAARLCAPDAASIATALDEVLRDPRAPNGREAVADLSVERVAQRIIQVYRDVLERRVRKPRVLMIVENLPVPFDRRVWQEAKALHDAGWRVSVICPRMGEYIASREIVDGIEVFRHPLPEARGALGYPLEYAMALFWQTWLAWRIFWRHRFDVIHACNPPDLIFLVALPFKLLAGTRFVFDHHDLCPELGEAKFGDKSIGARLMRRLLATAERATFRVADVSIATNESYRAIAIERGGMAPDDVFVVRSAPDSRRWQPVPPDPTARDGARHLVGYVGVMGNQEGLSDLLAIVEDLVRRRGRHDIRFLLIGSGPELPCLREETRKRGIEAAVRFTGRIPDADLTRLLSSCDLCVNPDPATKLNSLSSMNKIVEYMALGRPMVQFDLQEGRFTAGTASLYAIPGDLGDFADKIVALLADPGRRRAMGETGRRRFLDVLAWEHQAPELLRCYARLVPDELAARPHRISSRGELAGS